jgi:hypothetical protein
MATDSIKIVYSFVDKSSSGITSAIGGLGKLGAAGAKVAATGLAAATAAMAAAGVAAIKLGSDAEEMQGKFDVVFANVGGEVTKQLTEFAGEVGRSRFELMEMASTFGDTLKPIGFAEDAAGDMSVTLSKLATDLGSFNNMPMDEALQRLQGTLIGNHENALAFGVIINENVLKQELMRMGADKLTGSMLEQAKVQARMNLLLAGTTDAQGDALRTAGSFANQMRALKSTIFDAGTEIGLSLLPMVTPLVSKLGELAKIGASKVVPVFEGMSGAFERFATMNKLGAPLVLNMQELFRDFAGILGLDEEFWASVGGAFGGFIEDIRNGVPVVEAFAGAFAHMATPEQKQAVEDFSGTVLDFLADFEDLESAGVGAFTAIKTSAEENRTDIDAAIIGIGAAALVAGGSMISFQTAAVTAFGATLMAAAPVVLMLSTIAAGVAVLKLAWDKDFMGMQTTLKALADQVATIGGQISQAVGIWVGEAVGTLNGWHDQIVGIMALLDELLLKGGWVPQQGGTFGGRAGHQSQQKDGSWNVPDVLDETWPSGSTGGGATDAGGAGSPPQGWNPKPPPSNVSNKTTNNVIINTNANSSTLSSDFNMINAMAGGI